MFDGADIGTVMELLKSLRNGVLIDDPTLFDMDKDGAGHFLSLFNISMIVADPSRTQAIKVRTPKKCQNERNVNSKNCIIV
jgi:hypothetical protein